MDLTLRDYLTIADNIHNNIEYCAVGLSKEVLEQHIEKLQSGIRIIQSVAKRMADISNVCTELILMRHKHVSTSKIIECYPTENDHASLRRIYSSEVKQLLPDIDISVKQVPSLKHVPVTRLYWVEDIKSYAINVEGVNIRGNLANIVPYQTKHSAVCEYGASCPNILSCNFYHDPEDYIKLDLPVPEIHRSLTVGSYIYSAKKTPKTYFARHLGGYNTLTNDLLTLHRVQYRDEISTRESQLMHDLLVYMALHSKGMLERYNTMNFARNYNAQ